MLTVDQVHPSYQSSVNPHSVVAEGILAQAGFCASPRVHERSGHTLLSYEEAQQFLLKHYERQVHPHLQQLQQQRRIDPRPSSLAQPSSAPRRRGRPKKADALPSIHGNRKLEQHLQQAGLTTAEKTIARKVLSLLRAERIATGRGKFINRSSLGSDRTVKRTFSKLRAAGLITDSRPVKGCNQTRLTNLGPVFIGGLAGQPQGASSTDLRGHSEGPKLAPQTPNFDTPKPLANTGDVVAILAPRFINPLKRVHREPVPLASASLRAAASEPGFQQAETTSHRTDQQLESGQPLLPVEAKPERRLINGMRNPLNLANGDQVKYQDQISTVVSFCWESDQYLIRIVESGETVRCDASRLSCMP